MKTPQGSSDLQPPAPRAGAPGAVDLAGWLARKGALAPPATAAVGGRRAGGGGSTVADRAAAYLAKLPPAVSGQKGHDRTFHAACVAVKGFGLTVDQARPILEEWNRGCEPPWSAAELEHKLKSADAAPDDRPRGRLAEASRAPGRRRGGGGGGGGGGAKRGAAAAPGAAPDAAATAPDCGLATEDAALAFEGSEANPHRLALVYLASRHLHPDGVTLRYWRGEFHEWSEGVYRVVSPLELRARLAQCLADEFKRIHELTRDGADERGRERRRSGPTAVNTRLVGDVLQALAGLALLPADRCGGQPAWIEAAPEALADLAAARRPKRPGDDPESGFADRACDLSGWPAADLMPARNGVVHPFSYVTGARCAMPPTPRFFNAHALDYDFDPNAPRPRRWLEFLSQVWPDDPASAACLQEWFGYLSTADTRLQKMLMVIGPPRSGKGTIGRVLKALAGPSNVVNPGLSALGRSFGPAMLIDKPIAVFSDMRLSKWADNAVIVESLLSISGEDDQSVDRKHRPAWTGRLPTRFVFISNQLPMLRDASGALSSRLVVLRCKQSFAGREDPKLFDALKHELPGILLWAFEGWERLRRRGRFVQPDSARDLTAAMSAMSSPISSFLDDRCVRDPDALTSTTTLFEAWREWCREHGRDAVGEDAALGASLFAAVPNLSKTRLRIQGARICHYRGIRLRTALDDANDQD